MSGMLATLRGWRRDSRVIDARDALEKAIKDEAVAYGVVASYRSLKNHYATLAAALDPHQDWHYFARVKDRAEEACEALKRAHQAYTDATAKREAAEARVEALA